MIHDEEEESEAHDGTHDDQEEKYSVSHEKILNRWEGT